MAQHSSISFSQFPLLAVSLELHLQIYKLVLASDLPASSTNVPPNPAATSNTARSLSFLLGSRQIYHEARDLPFQHTSLDFARRYGSSFQDCLRFPRPLSP
jgi:hypothetical protein